MSFTKHFRTNFIDMLLLLLLVTLFYSRINCIFFFVDMSTVDQARKNAGWFGASVQSILSLSISIQLLRICRVILRLIFFSSLHCSVVIFYLCAICVCSIAAQQSQEPNPMEFSICWTRQLDNRLMADKKKTALCISDINKSPPFNRREEQSENKYRDTQTHTDKHTHTHTIHTSAVAHRRQQ